MYSVRLLCPADSTNRSRPSQWVSLGSWRMVRWNRVYASGARLIAVPGCPLPTFCTASAASTRIVSTAAESISVQSSGGLGRVRAESSATLVTNSLLTSVDASDCSNLMRRTKMVERGQITAPPTGAGRRVQGLWGGWRNIGQTAHPLRIADRYVDHSRWSAINSVGRLFTSRFTLWGAMCLPGLRVGVF